MDRGPPKKGPGKRKSEGELRSRASAGKLRTTEPENRSLQLNPVTESLGGLSLTSTATPRLGLSRPPPPPVPALPPQYYEQTPSYTAASSAFTGPASTGIPQASGIRDALPQSSSSRPPPPPPAVGRSPSNVIFRSTVRGLYEVSREDILNVIREAIGVGQRNKQTGGLRDIQNKDLRFLSSLFSDQTVLQARYQLNFRPVHWGEYGESFEPVFCFHFKQPRRMQGFQVSTDQFPTGLEPSTREIDVSGCFVGIFSSSMDNNPYEMELKIQFFDKEHVKGYYPGSAVGYDIDAAPEPRGQGRQRAPAVPKLRKIIQVLLGTQLSETQGPAVKATDADKRMPDLTRFKTLLQEGDTIKEMDCRYYMITWFTRLNTAGCATWTGNKPTFWIKEDMPKHFQDYIARGGKLVFDEIIKLKPRCEGIGPDRATPQYSYLLTPEFQYGFFGKNRENPEQGDESEPWDLAMMGHDLVKFGRPKTKPPQAQPNLPPQGYEGHGGYVAPTPTPTQPIPNLASQGQYLTGWPGYGRGQAAVPQPGGLNYDASFSGARGTNTGQPQFVAPGAYYGTGGPHAYDINNPNLTNTTVHGFQESMTPGTYRGYLGSSRGGDRPAPGAYGAPGSVEDEEDWLEQAGPSSRSRNPTGGTKNKEQSGQGKGTRN